MILLKTLVTVIFFSALVIIGGCSHYSGTDTPVGPSQVTPKVFMDPSAKSATVGSQFTLNVYIENVTNLFYANIYIKYDPAKISYVDSAMGGFLQQGSFYAFDDPLNGIVNVSPTRQGKSNGGVSGSGVLCTVTFKAVSATAGSATKISFLDENGYYLGFRDPNDNEIQRTIGNWTAVTVN